MSDPPAPTFGQRFFARYSAANDSENDQRYASRKRALFGELRGRVLEIGPGTGVNLPYLDPSVQWIGIEPNPEMHPHLLARAQALGLGVDLRRGTATALPADDASVDAVISTTVLCSVDDVDAALAEIRRVLRPGGTYRFIEHVADRPGVRRALQELLPWTPWWILSDGCNPARDLGAAIEAVAWAELRLERYMQAGRGVAQSLTRPHISGVAVR